MSFNPKDLSEAFKPFGATDYAVFAAMLIVCSCIGLFFGYKDKMKQKSNKLTSTRGTAAINYLLGGKNLQLFPVSMSLVATFISGVGLLGTSSEIYRFGLQYACILAGPLFMGVYMHFIIIPVFYDLNVISMFEYLQKRFDMRMRLFGSLISSFSSITFYAIAIYVPALAFNQTTGVDVHIITPVVMAVCVFYTCLGGIKAVIWTDVIQIIIMYGVLIVIIVKGTMNVGGLGVILERNLESGRIEVPDFRLDPTIRHSFWTLFVGGSCLWIIVNTNQNVIQRFLALKDQRTAQKASMIYVVGLIVLLIMCIFNGLILYATFYDCDPLTTKLAKAQDQMIPLLVMTVLKDIPGCSGLFVAGVFSASLSTLSSGLNSMSALVLEDYVKPMFKDGISERVSGYVMRGTVLIQGVLYVGLVYVVQRMGSVLQLSMSIPATFGGCLFGSFIIGLFLPWIGKRATFYGALVASAVMIYVMIRAQLDMMKGLITFDAKVTSVEGCEYNFTLAEETIEAATENYKSQFHNISYLYYTPLGAIITCVSAFMLSFWFGFEDPNKVDPRLLAPFMRKYFNSSVPETVADNKVDKKDEQIGGIVQFSVHSSTLQN